MNRIYRVIWNCTLQAFQVCSELTRRVGKTSTVNLRKSSGLTTKLSRLTLGVLLALSGSASGASLEVDNDQILPILILMLLMMPTWLAGMALECLIFWLAVMPP